MAELRTMMGPRGCRRRGRRSARPPRRRLLQSYIKDLVAARFDWHAATEGRNLVGKKKSKRERMGERRKRLGYGRRGGRWSP